MKVATVETESGSRPVVVVEDRILDIASAWKSGESGPAPNSVLDIVRNSPMLAALRQVVEAAGSDLWSPLAGAKLLAPIPRPAKNVFCVGRNYKLHIEEGARARGVPAEYPPLPEFFTKPPTTVIGPEAEIRLPGNTQKLDYEVELAFVVGRTGRDISVEDALGHIFGFTVLNDVTARDLQRAHGQWFKGKALDTTCPIGPWIVTADEFDVTQEHRLWLTVNGEIRQDAFISDMVFDCAAILSSLSAGMTVEAGDIITTGTPSGVGLGLNPQIWLKDGDVVEAGIEGIGSIRNTVRAV
ncbi:2-keto-4-pentenoate hydratase/2-oxohepta-3-ene-1,7-dioic acid hydratase in catechol pathway [Neorhizobium galegae]|uniref:fumarylacetoacetate hydrolase family protein n=1 Tax=Neorhizobium galegae TaxID=399 RepID=UPI001AE40796|nr:fumarylacetoacetate hydrolase family protein [Neorhizobium galegae]MBP2562287.1 2-keto-4-pentenoate hydratase/2-oxohepta-3-ene-1,7-dioic acid hydratase in catechol pathway [Neorhizobium galegae]MDQ0138326.1 2-keto-4-pentenoate hydratase/2-oxohepta-3-ene-1,7-dioic acid hydratase in catechol pathway [Neorhizobium galegae]